MGHSSILYRTKIYIKTIFTQFLLHILPITICQAGIVIFSLCPSVSTSPYLSFYLSLYLPLCLSLSLSLCLMDGGHWIVQCLAVAVARKLPGCRRLMRIGNGNIYMSVSVSYTLASYTSILDHKHIHIHTHRHTCTDCTLIKNFVSKKIKGSLSLCFWKWIKSCHKIGGSKYCWIHISTSDHCRRVENFANWIDKILLHLS